MRRQYLTDTEACVLMCLRRAHTDYPIKGHEIAEACGTHVHNVQAVVGDLVAKGYPICARCTPHRENGQELPVGYYWPDTPEEAEEALSSLASRFNRTREHWQNLRAAVQDHFDLEARDEQLRFSFVEE